MFTKLTAILTVKKLNVFSQDWEQDKGHTNPFLSTSPDSAENKKAIQIGNEEVKLSPFRDGVIFYVENPKELSLLQLISKVSKVARLKVNNWILNFFSKNTICNSTKTNNR